MTPPRGGAAGFGVADIVLVLAALAVAAALAWPRLRAASFDRRVAAVVADIDAVRSAALRHLRDRGRWPDGAAAGAAPDGLGPYLLDATPFRTRERGLQWHRWRIVEPPLVPDLEEELPPDLDPDSLPPSRPTVYALAGISMLRDDPDLLAALLARYGSDRSFVRDTIWTVVLPWRPEAPPRRRLGPPS